MKNDHLNLQQTADTIGIAVTTLRKLLDKGVGPPLACERPRRVSRKDVKAFKKTYKPERLPMGGQKKRPPSVPFTVRLSVEMHEKLMFEADKNKRSLTAHIEFLLEQIV